MEPTGLVTPLGWDFALEAPLRNRAWYEVRGYEPYSAKLFEASCRRSDVVIDIGAHVGFYSLVAAQANPEARLIAVEASPTNAEVLRRNVEGSGALDAEVINAAFLDAAGTVTVQLTEASDNSSLTGHPDSPTLERVEVKAISGDDLGIEPGSRVTVKIDVEGHEIRALHGLESVLDAAAEVNLFIEFNPKCIQLADHSESDILGWLFDRKFRVFALDDAQLSWRELKAGQAWQEVVDPLDYANFYCVPGATTLTMASVMHSGGLGGVERSQMELAAALIAQGHLVHTIIPEPDLGSGEQLIRVGSSVTFVPAFPWWMLPPAEVIGGDMPWAGALANIEIVKSLGRVDPDVIVTPTAVIAQGAIAAAFLDKPHLWYLREFGDLDHGLQLPVAREDFGQLVAGLSDVVLAISIAVRDHFFGGLDTPVSVVGSIPLLEAWIPAEHPEREWTLGVVGSFNPGKGHADALAAVARLRAQGVDVPLVFVGSGDPSERDQLKVLAGRLGLTDLITMTGSVEDTSEIYSLFDAVAVTSRAEAFGRVPFEAAQAGLPILYAESGGIAEFMTTGETGLAYPPGDIDALAAAILRLRADPAIAQGLVERARLTLLDPALRSNQFNDFLAALRRARNRGEVSLERREIGWLATSAISSAAAAQELVDQLIGVNARYAALEKGNRELDKAHRDLRAQYGDLVTGNLGLAEAHDRLQAEHAELVLGNRGLAMAHDVRGDQLAAAIEANERVMDEVDHLLGEIGRLESVEAEHRRVIASKTWRFSAPARAAWNRLRRSS